MANARQETIKMNPKNFSSTVDCETRMTPHRLYEAMAIDAALLAVDEQLPTMSDEEQQCLLDVASEAAKTVLLMAKCQTTGSAWWRPRTGTERRKSALRDAIYELMPATPKHITEAVYAAIDCVRCALPTNTATYITPCST